MPGKGARVYAEYLKHLPISILKIDGEFVRQLPISRTDQETVRDLGVDFAQGYHLGKPEPVSALRGA